MKDEASVTEDAIEGLSLSIIIPAFNEQDAIYDTVAGIREAFQPYSTEYEIIVVDDGSTDNTLAEARRSGARVETNGTNSGYGATLKRGIRASRHEFVAIIDADATYPPRYLPAMLAMARDRDMVVGDRGAAMKNVPFVRRPAKKMLNWLAGFLAERPLNDLNSGLRVFRKSELVPFLPLLPSGFSFTTTITLCMACSEKRMIYTPIEYGARVGKSKIRPIDFLRFIVLVLRIIMLFNPLRIFLPAGLVLFVLGLAKTAYDVTQMNLSESAIFLFLTALMLWSVGLLADMIARLHLRP